MKAKILRLSDSVINQIAAGEVVESPASIVKELIENSLDAGSKCISIEIVQGGHELIRVEDDGSGMNREDALLSIERHATSKIHSVEDLSSLETMGFRGEALAAISSVSEFVMLSSDGKNATRIVSHGGKNASIQPFARNQGTTIEIRSLFFNVPARKKFQKSPAASMSQIRRVVETIALAHPEEAFSLNGQEYAPTDLKSRIEEILGEHEHEIKAAQVVGFVGAPSKASSNRVGQYVFINRRPIFSPLISKAVKEAFATRIAEHAFPRFVLFLELPPDEVDVNVHPQKKEVRFKNDGKIFSMVRRAIEKAFAPRPTFQEPVSFSEPPVSPSNFSETFPTLPFKVEDVDLDFIYKDQALGVFGKFLLLQRKSLVLVDLSAAHARILFESFVFEKGLPQALILPIEIELAKGEEEKAEKLSELGIECRILKRMLVIDALPPFLDAANFSDFFVNFKEGRKMEEISTRFVRSSKKNYSLDEAMRLWQKVKTCRDTLYDPIGNPIYVEIHQEDLERLMGKNGKCSSSKI